MRKTVACMITCVSSFAGVIVKVRPNQSFENFRVFSTFELVHVVDVICLLFGKKPTKSVF